MVRWSAVPMQMGMASLTGCTTYREVTVDGVENVRLAGMDAQGMAVRVEVRVTNPNRYRIHVHDPELDLYLNETRIGTAVLDTPLTVPARSTSTLRIPLHARVDGGPLLVMGLGMLLGDRPVLRAEGTVGARAGLVRKRFPIRLEAPLQR
ncbi:MAG: LEA type 2 family protein [Flavobacteriales bacterium]|nr:LEA type 2 family protein [Flavobacteriales bacterium]